MPKYRRAFVPRGCWFFTISLLECRKALLVDRVDVTRIRHFTARRALAFFQRMGATSMQAESSARDERCCRGSRSNTPQTRPAQVTPVGRTGDKEQQRRTGQGACGD